MRVCSETIPEQYLATGRPASPCGWPGLIQTTFCLGQGSTLAPGSERTGESSGGDCICGAALPFSPFVAQYIGQTSSRFQTAVLSAMASDLPPGLGGSVSAAALSTLWSLVGAIDYGNESQPTDSLRERTGGPRIRGAPIAREVCLSFSFCPVLVFFSAKTQLANPLSYAAR